MKIRVYRENGNVKITKVTGDREDKIFSHLYDGEVAEIEVESYQSIHAIKEGLPRR